MAIIGLIKRLAQDTYHSRRVAACLRIKLVSYILVRSSHVLILKFSFIYPKNLLKRSVSLINDVDDFFYKTIFGDGDLIRLLYYSKEHLIITCFY